ncbi:hypothetical protein MKX03_006373 [Papaver bracteatum]|nr:hypothetical protein MKX03_006373 [Papaver bracteatum]
MRIVQILYTEPANVPEQSTEPMKEPVCSFFRKPSKNKNIRKRKNDDEEEDNGEEGSSVVQKPKLAPKADNKLHFSTGTSTKHVAETNQEPKESRRFHFESSKVIEVQHDSRATAALETETDFSNDARAIRERVLKRAEKALKKNKDKKPSDEKLYKGIHGYKDHKAGFRTEHTVAGEKAGGAHGPLRGSAHIRTSARWDYQPDICKDYKETGYCGFGDSCKLMHDRGDYKSGWQMNLALKADDDEDENGKANVSDDDEDALPFACFICRQSFVDPVVTKCKHYFCEHCALKHHSKNKKCFVCNTPTLGMFNTAHEIRRKMAAEGK